MRNPLVTVLIVTWNRLADVLIAVRSVIDQHYSNVEIVVVDNGSTDGTADTLRRDYPSVRIVSLSENLGVTRGRNAGISGAQGEIVFLLDSDASIAPGAIGAVVDVFRNEPEVGVINSKILNEHSQRLDGPGWVYAEHQRALQNTSFASWSFSEGGGAIRKEVFDRVGLFWDKLFFGCEGQEFSIRVWNAGYEVRYCPTSIVYHRASKVQRIAGRERDIQLLRSTLYIFVARYPVWMFLFVGPLKIGAVVLRATMRGYFFETLKALLGVVGEVPALLSQRRTMRHSIAWKYLRLMRQQGPLSWTLGEWMRKKM